MTPRPSLGGVERDDPGWRRIGVLVAGLAVLAFGVGSSLFGRPGPEDAVEAYARDLRDADCTASSGTYSTDEADELSGKLDVCGRGDGSLELGELSVTEVDESPAGVPVPEGATEVARVAYAAEAAAAGATARYDGAFVVARFDGEWEVVGDAPASPPGRAPDLARD